MKVDSPTLLKTVFGFKGNFAQGLVPEQKSFSGVEIAPFRNAAQAAVSISADFEMSWAWRGRDPDAARIRGIQERANVPLLLEMLDDYSIPITWATVGHLFLESCTRSCAGLAHTDMPRPKVNDRWTGDWYLHDPCSDVRREPLWYAPDLVQQIIDSKTDHEIGTHTFSHINFSPRCSTSELVHHEMQACADAMRPYGITPRSLVFPHNIMGHTYLPLLAAEGMVAVRHRDERIRCSYPERTPSGVYKIYESMNMRSARYYDYLDKVKIFVEKAMERRAAYSLWLHPSDPAELFDDHFRRILQYLASEQKSGRIWVATMRDLASYCEAREQMQVTAKQDSGRLTVSIRSSLDVSRFGNPEVTLLVPASATPSSAWLEKADGERYPLAMSPARDSSSRVMVNIPSSAKALHFAF
jgi:hypothetical protein